MTRSTEIQTFLTSLEAAFAEARLGDEASKTLSAIFAAARVAQPEAGPSGRLPVCDQLGAALQPAKAAGGALADLAASIEALEPRLRWGRREKGGPFASEGFQDAHANAMILGAGGIEQRDDFWIGFSLMAPGTRYPDHNHPPEEVYLVLTPGEFRHGDSGWFAPGVGGTLYNSPGIEHAMRAADQPFLAVWCLKI